MEEKPPAASPEVTEDADSDIVDWTKPSDPENPREWPRGKKLAILITISMLAAVGEISSSIIAPSIPQIMDEFNSTNETLAAFTVSVFLLGLATGLMVLSGLSELYGRSPVFYSCSILFVVFAVASAVADNLASLIVFRFFLGVTVAAAAGIGGGTIADLFVPSERGRATSVYALGNLVGPLLGPIIGGYLGQDAGWRWVCWLTAILGGVMAIATLLVLRETYHPTLLKRRAMRLRKETGNQNLHPVNDPSASKGRTLLRALARPIRLLIFSPVVLLPCLGVAVITGMLYLLISTLATVFQDQYGFSVGSSGLAYLGLNIGLIFGLFAFAATSDKAYKKMAKEGATPHPEARLVPIVLAAPLICIGLLMYGWATDKNVHWMVAVVGTAIFGVGWMAFQMPVTTYLIDVFKMHAASAIGANAFLRSLLGALLPLCAWDLYNDLGLGWGNSLLAFIALAFSPLPWIFYQTGGKLRERFPVSV
ncbi:MFS general substrate transporter [Aulographum hederae CBS 113979]|uniref:MFS general substrate transporter n=1 Tax=Aulographum hederae CBS 113979 TaxID=1176131 RepID=A0A6G1H7A6_9PEZI|nr:MFS general substrate transporter [Aulographum hederae CBS 113979]